MENLINRYIFSHWKNGDYEQRWLRRITRQTKTQYISDVQRFLDLRKEEPTKTINNDCAQRYNMINDVLTLRYDKNWNDGAISTNILISDFNLLNLDYSFEEFKNDISELNSDIKIDDNYSRKNTNEDIVGNHLKVLFGDNINLCKIFDFLGDVDTIHEENRISKSSTKYHITIFGGNGKTISTNEDRKNTTISFWKFDDVLVWKYESGISSW